MPMYNLIEYSNSYSKTSGSLWQYYRDEPALTILFVLIFALSRKKSICAGKLGQNLR